MVRERGETDALISLLVYAFPLLLAERSIKVSHVDKVKLLWINPLFESVIDFAKKVSMDCVQRFHSYLPSNLQFGGTHGSGGG